jgi:glycosyltransferase 2 family protein
VPVTSQPVTSQPLTSQEASIASTERSGSPPRSTLSLRNSAIIAGKLAVTLACLWYVASQIELTKIAEGIRAIDIGWASLAVGIAVLQIPMLGLRWGEILAALGVHGERITRVAAVVVTSIGAFFAQVLPAVAGEGVRAWYLVRLGSHWRAAVTSLVIDRAVGVGLLIALAFVILLLPSGFTALGGYRASVLAVYAALLLAGAIGLLLVPWIAPVLGRWRYARWIADLAVDAHRVLLGRRSVAIVGLGCVIHVLTIVIIWSLGRAQGLALSVPDAALLFTVMIGVALVPISVSGWGLREVAVLSLLGHYGVAPERALLFSICFGLTLALGSLPGALAWLLYSVPPAQPAAAGGG